MSNQINYWESVIAEYKASGLSQPVFCKQHGLSWNQFQYRWSQYNLSKRTLAKNNCAESSFESVTISRTSIKEARNELTELAIYLPNQIRCEVKMDLQHDAFSVLLKQLVTLC